MTRKNRNPVRRAGDEPLSGYTQIPHDLSRAPIPFEARGLIVELASHADGFSVSVSEMSQRLGCTRGRVQSALNAALASEYLARKEYRTSRGHAFYEYWVRTDRPFTARELTDINATVYLQDKASVAPETSGHTDAIESPTDTAESQPDAIAAPSTVTAMCRDCHWNEAEYGSAYCFDCGTLQKEHERKSQVYTPEGVNSGPPFAQ